MFLLDTNVISELANEQPDWRVLAWLNTTPFGEIATASVCIFEVGIGVEAMPLGKRRDAMEAGMEAVIEHELGGGILELGEAGSRAASAAWGQSRRSGGPTHLQDLLIAGTATEHGATLVTRNVKHFQGLDIPLLNPWDH